MKIITTSLAGSVIVEPKVHGDSRGFFFEVFNSTRQPDPAAPIVAQQINVSRSARTRERILKTSLDLFNAHGESNVTTGHIADELNISPGNLYYHFRNKDEIIHHLFADFEKQIDVAPAGVADAASAMEDLWLYLHVMFERIW